MYANDQERIRGIWDDNPIYKYGYQWSEYSVIVGNSTAVCCEATRFAFSEYHEKIRED